MLEMAFISLVQIDDTLVHKLLKLNFQILCLTVKEKLTDSVAVLLQLPGENIRHEDPPDTG